jgi:hypothetical protein
LVAAAEGQQHWGRALLPHRGERDDVGRAGRLRGSRNPDDDVGLRHRVAQAR